MRKTAFTLALAGLVFLAGCIPCLRAIYTEKDLVFEPALVGTWHQADSKGVWQFTKAGGKSYRLVYTDPEGKPGEFSAHLVKIDGTLFLDLYPEDPHLAKNAFYVLHVRPMHTFLLVQAVTPELRMSAMNPKWLGEHLKADPEAVRHEETEQGILLTASTQELQAFLAKHCKTKEAWGEPPLMKKKPQ
jgi:hypothetical protein